jgi:Raf kinase inhibitor-like YbhB/YbcL family protein
MKLFGTLAAVLFALGSSPSAWAESFKLSSSAIQPGGTIGMDQVYNSFGCTGKNISPPLIWKGAPKDTKAFALTMYDPDAPTGSGWWHWVVINIDPHAGGMPANAGAGENLPKGAQQMRTDFGKPGYGGPCPPPGKPHHYIFTIYALKDLIQVDADASPAMVGFYINSNKISSAKLTGIFGR